MNHLTDSPTALDSAQNYPSAGSLRIMGKWLSTGDAATYLGVTSQTIRRMIHREELTPMVMGEGTSKRYYVNTDELDKVDVNNVGRPQKLQDSNEDDVQ